MGDFVNVYKYIVSVSSLCMHTYGYEHVKTPIKIYSNGKGKNISLL